MNVHRPSLGYAVAEQARSSRWRGIATRSANWFPDPRRAEAARLPRFGEMVGLGEVLGRGVHQLTYKGALSEPGVIAHFLPYPRR